MSKKLRCFLKKFTQLTKILHDRRSRRSRQIPSLPFHSSVESSWSTSGRWATARYICIITQKPTRRAKNSAHQLETWSPRGLKILVLLYFAGPTFHGIEYKLMHKYRSTEVCIRLWWVINLDQPHRHCRPISCSKPSSKPQKMFGPKHLVNDSLSMLMFLSVSISLSMFKSI